MENEEPYTDSTNPAPSGDQEDGRVLKAGESFGNFRVVKCMAASLIANYYHMQHVRDLHDVTVGVFHQRTAEDPKFLKRLQGLQKTFQGFDHESIPKIVDCSVINERHCIFMEPVYGQSLSQYFAEHTVGKSGLELDASTRIIAQLLSVLGSTHSQLLDHRDLNSDLVFIHQSGSLQVLGLGIKSALGIELFEGIVSASVSPLVSSKTPERLNSFEVMSPEYRAGLGEDSRVDLYSIGMVGYWLITGQKATAGQFVAPSSLVDELSIKWDIFFQKCLERDAEARYQSCKIALLGLKDTEAEPSSERAGLVQRQIDRILVPKQILDRGQRVTSAYRLVVIGIVGLILTALTVAYFEYAFTEEEEVYERAVAKKANAEESPSLVLSIAPPVAKVEFVGQKDKFISSNGEVGLFVQPGVYELLITAPHYVDETVSVEIPKRLEAPVEVEVELVPAWADVKIKSVPNAIVSVTDTRGVEVELGVTDADGLLFLEKRIYAGVYQVSVKKDGYVSGVLSDQEITLGDAAELEVELVALPAEVTIGTEPAGAQILIDGGPVGVTPLVLDTLKPGGKYLVVAQLDKYRTVQREVELKGGKAIAIDFGELVRRSGSLQLNATFAGVEAASAVALRQQLQIELDGLVFPFSAGVMDTVIEGAHEVRLLHPEYVSALQTINLSDKEKVALDFQLLPKPGVVEVALGATYDASILVDGALVKWANGRVEVPANKEVELTLRIQDHLTMIRRVKLGPNQQALWEVNAVPIPGPQVGENWTIPYLNHQFSWIEPGSYKMGSPLTEAGRLPNEGPQTPVEFSEGFWAGVHEVTQAKYFEIMERNTAEFRSPQNPVENVNWSDAQLFCKLLTEREAQAGRLPEGYVYRLPTEAEWEYIARAGTQTPFSFGSLADAQQGNFQGVYPKTRSDGERTSTHYGTVPVASYEPNAFGLYDVHGNVQEWTADHYNGRLEGERIIGPSPRSEGTRIAVRGGSWEDFATATRSAIRQQVHPSTFSNAIGFRIILASEL